jgi:hypothetical protein
MSQSDPRLVLASFCTDFQTRFHTSYSIRVYTYGQVRFPPPGVFRQMLDFAVRQTTTGSTTPLGPGPNPSSSEGRRETVDGQGPSGLNELPGRPAPSVDGVQRPRNEGQDPRPSARKGGKRPPGNDAPSRQEDQGKQQPRKRDKVEQQSREKARVEQQGRIKDQAKRQQSRKIDTD